MKTEEDDYLDEPSIIPLDLAIFRKFDQIVFSLVLFICFILKLMVSNLTQALKRPNTNNLWIELNILLVLVVCASNAHVL